MDTAEIKEFTYSQLAPVESISTSSSYSVRASIKNINDINKVMLKNFVDEHGFETLRSLAPEISGRNLESTIEKLANSPTFNDDYRSLVMKASSYKSKSQSRSTATTFLNQQKFLH